MPTFVDLSAPITPSPTEWPDALRTEIEWQDHRQGAEQIEQLTGVTKDLLREEEGWATETFLRLSTHGTTHVDAPWHYNSRVGGERARTIDELPLDLFFAPGVKVDATDRADGEALDTRDFKERLPRPLRPRDIVLVHTGRDAHYDEPGYMALGPGVTQPATRWLFEQGVRVMGIDAWGWDRPLHLQAEEARAERRANHFWAAHQADLPYCQIERLFNLAALPAAGFTVACFPLKVVGGSAGPCRAVAILDAAQGQRIPGPTTR